MLKKVLVTVLTAMLVAFFASSAMAIDGLLPDAAGASKGVVVNPGGLGQTLVYGYYNTRNTNVNLFNIVNTNVVDGEKVRVVFRAGKDSEEVLDFSVCLSRTDVWTAYLIDNGTTATICPIDTDTVTAPIIPAACQPFKIPSGSTLTNDDLREGYFEVFGLSSIPGYDKNASVAATKVGITGNYIIADTDCATWCSATDSCDVGNGGSVVKSVLMGNNAIVDLTNLATYSYNAAAMAGLNPTFVEDPGPGSEIDFNTLGATCAEIDAALEKGSFISPYDLETAVGGQTELIVTFPTRRGCHQLIDTKAAPGIFKCVADTSGAAPCVTYATPVVATVYDDKENAQNVLGFSPAGAQILPNEVNVLVLGGSSIWNSSLTQTFSANGQLGWVSLGLTTVAAVDGLPALGYTTQSFNGNTATYMVPMAYTSVLDAIP